MFHGRISDKDRPYISAGFGDHQHPDERDRIRPQHHRYVETEAQHNGQPHPAERPVSMLLCAAIKQHYHQKTQQGEGYVAPNTPGQRRFGAQPSVLRHHTQSYPNSGKCIHRRGQSSLSADMITLPPDIVQQHIENCHRNRGDPLPQSQRHCEVFQAVVQSARARGTR